MAGNGTSFEVESNNTSHVNLRSLDMISDFVNKMGNSIMS